MNDLLPRKELESLIVDLTASGGFAIKNPALFENLSRRGDWDILVEDLQVAEGFVVRHLGPPDGLARRSYVSSYFYSWGFIDLLTDWQWRGFALLSNDDLRASLVTGPDGLPAVGPVLEGVVTWSTKLLWNGRGDPRYRERVRTAATADPTEFGQACRAIFGRRLGSKLKAIALSGEVERADALVPRLRMAVAGRAICRHPWTSARGKLQFLRAEARLRLHPPVPMVSATSDELLARVDAAAVDSWSAVSGSVGVQLLAPRARWFRLARLTIRYWTTVAYHRTRCQIVVLLFETSARRQPLRRSKLLRLLVPAPDLEINEGDERLADLNEWLLTETRRRALVALLPANRFMAQSGDAA